MECVAGRSCGGAQRAAWRRAHAAVIGSSLSACINSARKQAHRWRQARRQPENASNIVASSREGRWSGLNAALRFSGGLPPLRWPGLPVCAGDLHRYAQQCSAVALRAKRLRAQCVRPPCYQSRFQTIHRRVGAALQIDWPPCSMPTPGSSGLASSELFVTPRWLCTQPLVDFPFQKGALAALEQQLRAGSALPILVRAAMAS